MKATNTIASGHQCVTDAAEILLREGGNAFDAMVGAGFATTIAEPTLTSLGGGGFMMVKPHEQPAQLYDFFVNTPGAQRPPSDQPLDFTGFDIVFPGGTTQTMHIGLASVAVPGVLRGLLQVHKEQGRLPLALVLQPAIDLARHGIIMNATQADLLDQLSKVLLYSETSRALFAPRGHLLKQGERFYNRQQADFMELLPSEGADLFYQGEVAQRMVEDMAALHGLVTRADLANYATLKRKPYAFQYGDYQLLTNPEPSFGGGLIALSLEEFGHHRQRHFGSEPHVLELSQTLQRIETLRQQGVLNPSQRPQVSQGTTHISIIDDEGNAASYTSSNGTGSGYIAPDTGIMLNNMMGEDDLHPKGFHSSPPGLRVASMMAPSLLCQHQQVRYALGTGGSKRIRTAIFQVISNLVDFGMSLEPAVTSPRLHWDARGRLQIEPGLLPPSASQKEQLADGTLFHVWPRQDLYFGGVHSVSSQGEAVGDPRRSGVARVFHR